MSQLPLSLVLPDRQDIAEFFVTSANQLAYDWIALWPDWPQPYRSVNIYGPKGCGKSHLGQIYASKSHCLTLQSLSSFKREDCQAYDGFLLDNLSCEGAWHEEALFHFMNFLAETGKTALVTSLTPVSQMSWRLPDLASRMRALASQQVGMPDDELLAALLDQYFADRQCMVQEPAVRYIMARVERSYEAVAEIAQAVDKISLAEKRPVTIKLIKPLFA